MKKLPIFVLLLLFVILMPFLILLPKMNEQSGSMNHSKKNLFDNFSQYEQSLTELGYNAKLTTDNGNQVIIITDGYVAYKFNDSNSCTAEFGNKSNVEKQFHATMTTKNIEEDDIEVTVLEKYQNMDLEHKCTYDKSGFDTMIVNTKDFDKQDREIKEIISTDYRLTTIYNKMISINNDLKELASKKN